MGSKIFINFTKYDYSECIRRLLVEIKNCVQNTNSKPSVDKPNGTGTKPPVDNDTTTSSKTLEWSEKNVEKWLNEKKINSIIIRNVYPCNGQILHQLFVMQCEAPEFFYKSISSNELIPTRDIAFFSLELKQLFQ